MQKRSGVRKVMRIPKLSSYHSELQKRVAIIGVSLIIILMLVGIGLYVAPGEFVGKASELMSETEVYGGHDADTTEGEVLVETSTWLTSGLGTPTDYTTAHCTDINSCVWNDAFCYPVGSIPESDRFVYCSSSFNEVNNVWVACELFTRYELTEDQTFICDDDGDYEWLQCTDEGEVRGEYRCDGDIWQQCGDGTAYICGVGYAGAIVCNEDRKFETEDRISGGTTIEDDYYCSYDGSTYAWIECTVAETLGEGVDNADNANRYSNNYVCAGGGSAARWQPIPNCAACAGELEGSCVGTSRVNVRDGATTHPYYASTQINNRIGCVAANECYLSGQEYGPDEAVGPVTTFTFFGSSVSVLEVCASGNSFLGCTDGAVAVPSDGGAWLCQINADEDEAGYGVWDRCTEDDSGTQIDNFICSYNADPAVNKWQWFSEFSCSPSQKYQVRDNGDLAGAARICDGTSWLSCADLDEENPFTDPDVTVTCAVGVISVSELQCNNNEDDDNDGLLDCDDSSCSSLLDQRLNENYNYEIVVKQGDCFTSDVLAAPPDLPPAYSQLNVCDLGTEAFANRVTLCEAAAAGTENTPILTLDSTSLLQNRFGQPYIDSNDLAFLFTESSPKTVSVMLARDISTAPLELPLETFAANFVAGQRVMLTVDGESYVLWHPTDTLFSEANLKLSHIATGTEIPALIYPGTNRYTFDLVGDRLMTFLIDTPLVDPENQIFRIETLPLGEVPQSFPIPTNLDERFEVTFSKASPVRFIEPADLGIFAVCRDDNDADPQQVKVCRNDDFDTLGFTLRAGNLTQRDIAGNNYAFLFEVANNTKQVSIFPLLSLSSASSSLAYDYFIDSMVAGRRTAAEFNDKLYLIKHPVAPFISLRSLALIRYVGDVTTTFAALGSEDVVEFLIPDGKITLARNYGNPPPPFSISALHTEEIGPIDLDLHLFASMSSLVPVTVNSALVEAADSVYLLDEQVFNINIGDTAHLLHLEQPEVISGNLFYYHSVIPSEGALLKQVSIYKLYDLTSGSVSRDYDAAFVEQFAGGKEFALLLGEQYYLIRYENNNNEVLSFNINRIRLSTLDRSTNFVAIPDGAGIRFDLPDGRRLGVRVNYDTAQLEFNTGADVLTETPFEPGAYMMELTPSNTVILGAVELRMCRLTAYNGLTSANVCTSTDPTELPHYDFVVNPLPSAAVMPTVIEIEGVQYLLEANGQTGNNKKVFIRRLLPLTPGETWPALGTSLYWFDFANEIAAGREPYFAMEDRIYVPQISGSQLSSLQFHAYGGVGAITARNVIANTPIAFNASFVLYDRAVHVEQQETTNEEKPLSASFFTPDYYYLPDNEQEVLLNTLENEDDFLSFVVAVDGIEYQLSVTSVFSTLVRLELRTGDVILQDRLFAEGESRTLHLSDEDVLLHVQVIDDLATYVNVTVRRD